MTYPLATARAAFLASLDGLSALLDRTGRPGRPRPRGPARLNPVITDPAGIRPDVAAPLPDP
ncbi:MULTISPECIES: hypothetical protein [unclassified Pseudonocardia]|uniref:hypothetical protein n=1 Tax=unclassified Pseudonocardia TaxID=2619320 RepID=UPI0002F1A553|nr:hypothetical protein [Pseudonocardia sp. Ae707_Ps1]